MPAAILSKISHINIMAFYLIGSYINSIDDSTMQQLNAMSDPAANIYQESLIKGFFQLWN